MQSIDFNINKSLILGFFFGLLFSYAGHAQLAIEEIEALKVCAARKGLERLDYDEATDSWSAIRISTFNKVFPSLGKKNRFSMIKPLEDLLQNVSIGYRESLRANKEFYHLIRRAYTSLSALYSYYKINPSADMPKQSEFMSRFSTVLIRLKAIVQDIEATIPLNKIYRALPGFDKIGSNITEESGTMTLKYLDMSAKGLAEINELLARVGNTETQIGRAMEFHPYAPSQLPFKHFAHGSQKKIAVFLIHGTFAAGSQEYHSDEAMLLKQAKLFAQNIANYRESPVELYSFGWNGLNDNEARMVAGEELANFTRTFFPSEEYHDVYIGHSHGGNVLLHFAHTLREYHTPFLIVTLATPVRKDFITDNLNYLVQFYADTDLVQHAGSYEITARNATGTGAHVQSARSLTRSDIASLDLFKNNDRFEQVKIYGVKVLFDYYSPSGMFKSHSDLKYLIGLLPRVLDTLFAYTPNNHFVLNTPPVGPKNQTACASAELKFQLMPAVQ